MYLISLNMPSNNLSHQTLLFNYFCKTEKEYLWSQETWTAYVLNFISTLSGRGTSQLKLFPRMDSSSYCILVMTAMNLSIYLEHIDLAVELHLQRSGIVSGIFLVSHRMTKCNLRRGFTHFSCFRYFSLYDSVNTKLQRTWQLDKSCGR